MSAAATQPAPQQRLSPWPYPSVLLAAKVAAIGIPMWILFADVLSYLAYDWWTVPAYSQGMLLPPFALYVAWLSRDRILRHPATADLRGLSLTVAACLLFVLGAAAAEYFLTRMSFVVLLAGLVWTFWGLGRTKELSFPLILLATMVPLPAMVYNSLAAPLQLFASDVAASVATAAGVSVFRDGNILQLAGGSLGVAEACSGLNSLSSLMVGGLLLGFIVCSSTAARVLLFCSAIPFAIAINVVRVAGTAIAADYDQELAMGFYHSMSGWLVFAAGFGCLYLAARVLNWIFPGREQSHS
jgi:exosortase